MDAPAGIRIRWTAGGLPLLENVLELADHGGVVVARRRGDAQPVRLARLFFAAQGAERGAQAAPRVPLVVRDGQVVAQRRDHVLPPRRLFVLQRQAKARTWIVRMLRRHLFQCLDPVFRHVVLQVESAADASARRPSGKTAPGPLPPAPSPLVPRGEGENYCGMRGSYPMSEILPAADDPP